MKILLRATLAYFAHLGRVIQLDLWLYVRDSALLTYEGTELCKHSVFRIGMSCLHAFSDSTFLRNDNKGEIKG